MNNQQEAIANAVKIIKKNLPTEEFLKNNKLSEALKSIYKSVDYIKGYFEAPAFSIFQYGFRYSPEQIQRMCKIVQGFDKVKSLDTRCQTIFMVYYRNQQISVLNNVLASYADKDFVEIQNNISGLPLTAKEKEELGLIKDESRKYFYYSTIISVVLAVAPFVGPKVYEYGKNFISGTNFVQEYQEQHQTEQLPKKDQLPIQRNNNQSEKTKQSKDLESLQPKQQQEK